LLRARRLLWTSIDYEFRNRGSFLATLPETAPASSPGGAGRLPPVRRRPDSSESALSPPRFGRAALVRPGHARLSCRRVGSREYDHLVLDRQITKHSIGHFHDKLPLYSVARSASSRARSRSKPWSPDAATNCSTTMSKCWAASCRSAPAQPSLPRSSSCAARSKTGFASGPCNITLKMSCSAL
jgi:hypothetical protein